MNMLAQPTSGVNWDAVSLDGINGDFVLRNLGRAPVTPDWGGGQVRLQNAGGSVEGPAHPAPRRHLLTVVLEDYYHVAPLKSVVMTDRWYRFERRVETNTRKALDLLGEFNISATFFVLGVIADEMPELVREVADRGHEIASKGYLHRSIRDYDRGGFRDDAVRSREALERASGSRVYGYRIGHGWFSPADLWALEVLATEGFAYDSSVRPLFRRYAREPWRRLPHRHRGRDGTLWEFPLSTWSLGNWSLPISGGNWFRQFPHWVMRRAVASWQHSTPAPFLMYFHVWELDPHQPRIQGAPLNQRVRQYRNLDKMVEIIRYYLGHYPFGGIADHLGLPRAGALSEADNQPVVDPGYRLATPPERRPLVATASRTPVSIVVPCFNEALILPYLANTLKSVEQTLGPCYDLHYIFVDDGSRDTTWTSLHTIFGDRANCQLIRHPVNRGVAAAIRTGISHAETEVVCSIDCDCTYDPHQLRWLLPMLTDEVDMVTASPYHRQGTVQNVPQWRLFLSRSLSSLYRLVLHEKLATYTSCFRAYRKSSVSSLRVREDRFLGVAEMLGQLDLQGGRIVECPAVLEARLLGYSKMKTVRTILGHLRLLARLAVARVRGVGPRPSDQEAPAAPKEVGR
jgi:polysaccharide deacetylase family protein (PEP-CTERM system associated)